LKKVAYIGADEVGRGPLAGPVVASGCLFIGNPSKMKSVEKQLISIGVCDSKKLSQKKRLSLLSELNIDLHKLKVNKVYEVVLFEGSLYFCLTEYGPRYIEKNNILQSSLNAMNETIEIFSKDLCVKAGKKSICLDGNKLPKNRIENWEYLSLVKGDSKCPFIGLASIIAKEYRDHQMSIIAEKYPGYGLEKHFGYPTKLHREAIKNLGVTDVHRKSFKGVKEYLS
tara:strand:- start:41183 stop:41860 length:678 start_codon:yes stop_codon:yes gene_type:complete